MLERLPCELVSACVLAVPHTDGRLLSLRTLRSVCWKIRSACNLCADELHAAQLALAERLVRAFPFRMKDTPVGLRSLQEWGTRAVELVRIRACELEGELVRCEAALLEAFGVDDATTMTTMVPGPESFFSLVTSTSVTSYRVEVQNMVHVDLGTVETFFNERGWSLDRSGALLVLVACSDMLDAGSTWSLNAHHRQTIAACERFDTLSATVRSALRTERGECELPDQLRSRFGPLWVSDTYHMLHMCITVCGSAGYTPMPSSLLCMYNGCHHLTAKELMDKRKLLVALVKRGSKLPNTLELVERKLNACFPMTALQRAATIPLKSKLPALIA